MELIIGIAVGLALGALVTWLVMRGKVSIAHTILEERTSALEQRSQELMAEQQRRHDEAMTAQQQRFNETIEKVTAQMKDATGEMLRQRQKEFQEASAGSIGQLVTPLRETIDKMQRTMAETQTRQSADSGALKTIIQQMMEKSEQTKRSTDELTRVFRHSDTLESMMTSRRWSKWRITSGRRRAPSSVVTAVPEASRMVACVS